jgi:hypothetical protein
MPNICWTKTEHVLPLHKFQPLLSNSVTTDLPLKISLVMQYSLYYIFKYYFTGIVDLATDMTEGIAIHIH